MTIKKQLFVAVIAVFLALAAVGARAQDTKPSPSPAPSPSVSPEKLALIQELMELTSSKKTIDEVIKSQTDEMEKRLPELVWATVSEMPEVARLLPLDRESIRIQVVTSALEASRKLHDAIMQKVDFNKIINDISVPLYDKYLTESELRDLIVFYKSPTGLKVIEVMPKLLTESMTQVGEMLVPKLMDVVMQMEREETQRMKKEVLEAVKTKTLPATPAKRPSRRRSKH